MEDKKKSRIVITDDEIIISGNGKVVFVGNDCTIKCSDRCTVFFGEDCELIQYDTE